MLVCEFPQFLFCKTFAKNRKNIILIVTTSYDFLINTIMTTMETTLQTSPKKANLSIKVGLDTKAELQRLAELKNRSVHFLMIEAVENYIAEQKAQAEYEKYVEERVMKAYNRFKAEGSDGVSSDEMYDVVMKRVQERLTKHHQ